MSSIPKPTFPRSPLLRFRYHKGAFVDGNKRVAVTAAEVFLLINDAELTADDEEIEKLTLGVAGGELPKEDVTEFFRKNVGEI